MNVGKWWNRLIRIINYLAGEVAVCTFSPVKNVLIRSFASYYHIDLQECRQQNIDGYPNLNSFFVRALRSDARPQPADHLTVSSPVDGVLYGCGKITDQLTVRVKGRSFNLAQLLGSRSEAEYCSGGEFALFYLAPHNYHRVHFPVAGRISLMRYLPGTLYSVNPTCNLHIPDLLALNERVVIRLESKFGPVVLVLVGAALVGSIETVWHGKVLGDSGQRIREWCYDACQQTSKLQFKQGDELGRFNFGSSVVLLLPENTWCWYDDYCSEQLPISVKVGNGIVAAKS